MGFKLSASSLAVYFDDCERGVRRSSARAHALAAPRSIITSALIINELSSHSLTLD